MRSRAGALRAHVDLAWALSDGGLCVDGWLVEADGAPGSGLAVDARVVQDGQERAWSPVLRKARPDVAEHLLGTTAGPIDLGFVGYVAGPIDPSRPATLQLRAKAGTVQVPLPDLSNSPVPEEAFAGLTVEDSGVTSRTLAPVVDVVRSSVRAADPKASLAYRHRAMTGCARIGIVVPVYGNATYVRNLLRALAGRHTGIEVSFVCDDPDLSDEFVGEVRSWNDEVYEVPLQVLTHDRNGGFAAACDAGWQAMSSEVVLLLNSDVLLGDAIPELNRLTDLLTYDVAAVGPVLTFPDGTLQHAGMEMVVAPDFPDFVLAGHPGKHGPVVGLPTEPFEVPMLTGAAICLRRDVLDAVGGVPRVYGRGDFEDVLLSLSLRDRGSLLVAPDIRWTHMEGASYQRDALGGIAVKLAKSVVVAESVGGRR